MIRGGAARPSPCNCRATSNPLSRPRSMSTSAMSGRSSSTCCTASALVIAVPTTATPSRSSRPRAASRKRGLSSTMRHRSMKPGLQTSRWPALLLPGQPCTDRRFLTGHREEHTHPWAQGGIDVRLRLVAPALVVIAVIAGALAVTQIESQRDKVLMLSVGLALVAVSGALAVTTERRRRAMREVERYFTLSPEMVILAGFDGYWKRVNPTVEAVLGYTEREALARPFMEFVHPDDRERTEEEARRVVAGATALAFENRIMCRDGSYKWIEWTVTPVPEERVMYGVGRDITERRRSDCQQTALQRIATLVTREVPQAEVFSAIAEEIGRLLGTEEIRMLRFDSDRSAVVVGSSGRRDPFPLGSRQQMEGDSVASRVHRTGQPARIDDYWVAAGPLVETARSIGVRAVVGVPVVVEGRLW